MFESTQSETEVDQTVNLLTGSFTRQLSPMVYVSQSSYFYLNSMELQTKTIHLLHDGDSYEILITTTGRILEIWRYDGNRTCSPKFINIDWCDEILQDRIYDRITRVVGDDTYIH